MEHCSNSWHAAIHIVVLSLVKATDRPVVTAGFAWPFFFPGVDTSAGQQGMEMKDVINECVLMAQHWIVNPLERCSTLQKPHH